MTLYEETMALMRRLPREITLSKIAGDTGIHLSWISRLKHGKLSQPDVHRIQRLRDCLASHVAGE